MKVISYIKSLLLFSLFPFTAGAQDFFVASPDAMLSAKVSLEKGRLFYEVQKSKQTVLEKSELGIEMGNFDFSSGLTLMSKPAAAPVNETYDMQNAKKSRIVYKANQVTVKVSNSVGKEMNIIFRVSNDAVSFQYYFPWVNAVKQTITNELTSFHFSNTAKAWLQPMSEAKTGWEHCHPSYEEHYLAAVPVGTPSKLKSGWVYPALFKTNDAWVLITEAGMTGTYCGTRLVNDSGSSVYKIGFPDPREVFTGRGYLPESDKPWRTPWRIITAGTLKTIIESTAGTDLAPASASGIPSFIKPGKASWSWINSKDENITYTEQKRYVDYASSMNWQYCLIDVNWDTKIGYDSIKILAGYAAAKKVGLILWYNSAGDWNTVTYHPKNLLLTHEGRIKEFSKLQSMGIKGVKIDFFGGDGQSMIQYYLDILNDAAKYKLLVNFHGATLPRGWAKTYPNLVTAEAVYGMEMVTFGQEAADAQPTHCTILPFTRNAFDPMDFTPVNMYKLSHSSSQRKTTSSFELALSVLFLSGIQHYAESPEGMSHVPGFVQQFLKDLPNYWDDVKFIDGYPGKFVIIARRSGKKWYVAGINGEGVQRNIKLDLSFLNGKKGKVITEGTGNDLFSLNSVTINGSMDAVLQPNGGFVMQFE